jgi:hypothetical protein
LRVFEKRVLKRIFGPKRDEVTGGWKSLRCDELHDLYCSSSVIKMTKSKQRRMARHVARMERLILHKGCEWVDI